MTSFLEVQFPSNISIGAVGGPEFSTNVVTINSGYESRNINWSVARAKYDVSHGVKTIHEVDQLIAFFRMVKGKAIGFRFKDYADFQVTKQQGVFSLLNSSEIISISTGAQSYQLYKEYPFSSFSYTTRKILKPIQSSFTLYIDCLLYTSPSPRD